MALFAYRAVDNGLAAIPLRTLVEAARNLGASMATALLRVVLPAIRSASGSNRPSIGEDPVSQGRLSAEAERTLRQMYANLAAYV